MAVVAACSGVNDSGTTKDTLATQTARRAQVPSPIAASPGASPGGSPSAPAPLPAGDAAAGQALYSSQGCQGCHSVDGSKVVGPSWKGIYGHQVDLFIGTTVTADDAYIHESIVQPQAKIVTGLHHRPDAAFPQHDRPASGRHHRLHEDAGVARQATLNSHGTPLGLSDT